MSWMDLTIPEMFDMRATARGILKRGGAEIAERK